MKKDMKGKRLMKDIFRLFLIFGLSFATMSTQAGWLYYVKDGTVTITGYSPSYNLAYIGIPSRIDGYPVTCIADSWRDDKFTGNHSS